MRAFAPYSGERQFGNFVGFGRFSVLVLSLISFSLTSAREVISSICRRFRTPGSKVSLVSSSDLGSKNQRSQLA